MSSPALPRMLECKNCCGGKFQVMIGTDEQLLTTLVLGINVPIVNGYCGPTFDKIRTAFKNGDIDTARKEQNKISQFPALIAKHGGGVPAIKALSELLGMDLGPVRLPLLPITSEQKSALKADFQKIGLIET